MSLKNSLADTLIGTAYQVGAPAVLPVKVIRKTVTESNGRRQETTEESRRYSVIGGAIRTFIGSFLVRKAIGIYRGNSQRSLQGDDNPLGGPSPPPRDVYDFRTNYLRRT